MTTEQFWSNTKTVGECLEWQGRLNNRGYGQCHFRGRTMNCHRLAWELARGPVPDGLQVLHACDNKRCVDPEHLHLGTHADNMREVAERGRAARNFGTQNGSNKYSPELIGTVLSLHKSGMSLRKISQRTGVAAGYVWHICAGKKWAAMQAA